MLYYSLFHPKIVFLNHSWPSYAMHCFAMLCIAHAQHARACGPSMLRISQWMHCYVAYGPLRGPVATAMLYRPCGPYCRPNVLFFLTITYLGVFLLFTLFFNESLTKGYNAAIWVYITLNHVLLMKAQQTKQYRVLCSKCSKHLFSSKSWPMGRFSSKTVHYHW